MVPSSPSHDRLQQLATKSKLAGERVVCYLLGIHAILCMPSVINAIVILSLKVSTQLVQVLKVTLPDMMAENSKEYLLIVCTMSNLLDEVNLTVIWALSTEIL